MTNAETALPQRAAALLAALLLLLALTAHSQTKKPAPVQPLPRMRSSPYGYRLEFPGTMLPTVPVTKDALAALGQTTQDRAILAEGVEVRLAAALDTIPGGDGPLNRLFAQVIDRGKPGPRVTFRQSYLDHKLWKRTPEEINETTYLINRGNASPDVYEFFGLARSQGKVYLGVIWYSPNDSFNPRDYGLVFRLDWEGKTKTLKPVPVRIRVEPGFRNPSYRGSTQPPYLSSLAGDGDLILMENRDLWRLGAKGDWQKLPHPALDWDAVDEGGYTFWLRGRWLLVQQENKSIVRVFDILSGKPVTAFDLLTGKPVRNS